MKPVRNQLLANHTSIESRKQISGLVQNNDYVQSYRQITIQTWERIWHQITLKVSDKVR